MAQLGQGEGRRTGRARPADTADTKQVATAFAGGTWATVHDQTRRNPVLVGAVAFVLGVLLGR